MNCCNKAGTIAQFPAWLSNQLANSLQVDLWSVGIILYELYVGQPPFYTNTIYALVHNIVRDPVKFPPTMSRDFKSLLQVCFWPCLGWPRSLLCHERLLRHHMLHAWSWRSIIIDNWPTAQAVVTPVACYKMRAKCACSNSSSAAKDFRCSCLGIQVEHSSMVSTVSAGVIQRSLVVLWVASLTNRVAIH